VEVSIPGKENIILKEGETFGENSLKENQFRSGTAKSLGKSHLLSIGREDIV
jgi:CRP-like cAMP-binding protein